MSIELDAIEFQHRGSDRPLFSGLSAQLATDGCILGLAGPSGVGKTTLAGIVSGLVSPTRGTVTVRRSGVAVRTSSELFGWVFQTSSALRFRSAIDNAMLPLMLNGADITLARSNAMTNLDAVNLGHRCSAPARHLSGGELQRLAIACALGQSRPFIILDEPTAQLDSVSTKNILEVVTALRHQKELTLIISHDEAVWPYCDDVYRLSAEGLESSRR